MGSSAEYKKNGTVSSEALGEIKCPVRCKMRYFLYSHRKSNAAGGIGLRTLRSTAHMHALVIDKVKLICISHLHPPLCSSQFD